LPAPEVPLLPPKPRAKKQKHHLDLKKGNKRGRVVVESRTMGGGWKEIRPKPRCLTGPVKGQELALRPDMSRMSLPGCGEEGSWGPTLGRSPKVRNVWFQKSIGRW